MRLPHGIPRSGSGVCRPPVHDATCGVWSCDLSHRSKVVPEVPPRRGYASLAEVSGFGQVTS